MRLRYRRRNSDGEVAPQIDRVLPDLDIEGDQLNKQLTEV